MSGKSNHSIFGYGSRLESMLEWRKFERPVRNLQLRNVVRLKRMCYSVTRNTRQTRSASIWHDLPLYIDIKDDERHWPLLSVDDWMVGVKFLPIIVHINFVDRSILPFRDLVYWSRKASVLLVVSQSIALQYSSLMCRWNELRGYLNPNKKTPRCIQESTLCA